MERHYGYLLAMIVGNESLVHFYTHIHTYICINANDEGDDKDVVEYND